MIGNGMRTWWVHAGTLVVVQMVGRMACTSQAAGTRGRTHLGGLGGGGVRLTSWGLTQSSPLCRVGADGGVWVDGSQKRVTTRKGCTLVPAAGMDARKSKLTQGAA